MYAYVYMYAHVYIEAEVKIVVHFYSLKRNKIYSDCQNVSSITILALHVYKWLWCLVFFFFLSRRANHIDWSHTFSKFICLLSWFKCFSWDPQKFWVQLCLWNSLETLVSLYMPGLPLGNHDRNWNCLWGAAPTAEQNAS